MRFVVACVALLVNIVLLIGSFQLIPGGVVLTLPGIAGIILTIGLAVDASEPDPADILALERFFDTARPEYVFVAAGVSGGIAANQRRPSWWTRLSV